ncbi:hypothetical protein CPB84DRAFT_1782514 [Gymnopilus junonius]|uniref:ferroxidase n=1 Tax=Gymnopilus junonius TaxID=109634 RepID=A0A9P5TLT8_GYMJU|nr:hypothetical protein CPB84DRAFT_1782514 [Gymnopilus junonius]
MLPRALRPVIRCSALSLRRLTFKKCVMNRVSVTPVVINIFHRCRMLSTPPPMVNESHLSMEEYHSLADKAMEDLLAAMEDLVELRGEADQEVDYHTGVLTLNLGHSGTYVINKQPPNKQIWLSSPISGPKRYNFHEETKRWVYSRDDRTLDELLSEELSTIFKEQIKISL